MVISCNGDSNMNYRVENKDTQCCLYTDKYTAKFYIKFNIEQDMIKYLIKNTYAPYGCFYRQYTQLITGIQNGIRSQAFNIQSVHVDQNNQVYMNIYTINNQIGRVLQNYLSESKQMTLYLRVMQSPNDCDDKIIISIDFIGK